MTSASTRLDVFMREKALYSQTWLRLLILIGLIIGALFILLYRLDQYPTPWFDEGSHLHVAKNYALNGVYADYSSEGNRPFGPTIGVGPTVLLPIAVVFRIFDVSIPLARLVIVIYALAALMALFGLARQRLSWPAAVIAVLAVFFSPGIEFIFNARTVLGEVPGLFWLMAGLWLWSARSPLSVLRLAIVGVLMGLACITKNQFAVIILPSLFLCWMADLLYYRQRGWRHYVIPSVVAGLIFGTWTYIVILRLGQGESFSENLASLREASAGAFLVLTRTSIEDAVRFLVDSAVYGAMLIPAVIYGLFLSLKRNETAQRWGTLMIFSGVGLLFYVASLGWPRYAFIPLVLIGIVIVRLMSDLSNGFQFSWASVRTLLRGQDSSVSIGGAIALGWIIIALLMPMYLELSEVVQDGSDDAYQVAAWINENIPTDALIETWEQELGVLTNHRYHYPPQIVLAHSVAEQWQGGPPASGSYDFREYGNPDYIIRGPFENYTILYSEERIQNYEEIAQIGTYTVLQRRN